MLPTTVNGTARRGPHRSTSLLPTYLRRIIKPKQMDLEYTFWLMLQLCISPKTAYRHTSYHKQTKNQWARDDPAFVVICCVLVATAATAYCVTFSDGLWHSVLTVASAVLVDFLLVGWAIATAGWFLANRFLRKKNVHSHAIEQHVEWMYAFDVHCNSYFPLFILLYVVQFLLSPLLLWRSFVSAVLSNALYAIALAYYHYLNFLGYSALPFLEHTEVFLWPVAGILLALPFAVLSSFNATRFTLSIYFG
ncbi:hypothetical protein WJX72_009176 [[Myrmecia] bisecta]|uniref:Unc-50-like protein n=1 Tax=[Myrmecia] bisecta TaxID=41462 RepID=A0AAW1R864_9CHLO